MENFKIEVDGDGVALVTFDVPGRSMNTITNQADVPVMTFTSIVMMLRRPQPA